MDDEQESARYEPSGTEQIARAIKSLDGLEVAGGFVMGAFTMFVLALVLMIVVMTSGDGEVAGCRTVERRNTLHLEATPACMVIMKSIVEGEDK